MDEETEAQRALVTASGHTAGKGQTRMYTKQSDSGVPALLPYSLPTTPQLRLSAFP